MVFPGRIKICPYDFMQKKTIAKYEIDSGFATGPFGESFKAKSLDGKGWVVVKVFSKIPHLTKAELENFKRRLKKISELKNSGIAHIYSAGKRSNGDPYVVTRFIEGVPLGQLCKEGLSSTEVLSFFHKIAAVVEFIHKAGIQHGNLKLSNIIIGGKHKQPFLLDFSILENSKSPALASRDSFLFAVILYEALMGKLPFGLNSYESIISAETDSLVFSELDNKYGLTVGRVFKKAFSEEREEYYPSLTLLVKDVADAIGVSEQIKDGKGHSLGEKSKIVSPATLVKKYNPLIFVLPAVVIATILAIVFAVVLFTGKKTNKETPIAAGPGTNINADLLSLAHQTAKDGQINGTSVQTADSVPKQVGYVELLSKPSEFNNQGIPSNLSAKTISELSNAQLLYILQTEGMDSKAVALAVAEVADRGGVAFFQPLQLLATHSNYSVRGSVALALRHDEYLHQKATFTWLTNLLYDDDPLVRGHAAKSLGKLGTDEARRALSMRLGIEKQQLVINIIKSTLGFEEE